MMKFRLEPSHSTANEIHLTVSDFNDFSFVLYLTDDDVDALDLAIARYKHPAGSRPPE